MFSKATVKTSFFCHLRFRFWRSTKGDSAFESCRPIIGAYVNVAGVPAICGRGIVWASRANADKISQGTQQNVVTGARPRLIPIHNPVVINCGVEKEINRHPTSARGHSIFS